MRDKKKEFTETEIERGRECVEEKRIAETKQWKMYQLNSFGWSRISFSSSENDSINENPIHFFT